MASFLLGVAASAGLRLASSFGRPRHRLTTTPPAPATVTLLALSARKRRRKRIRKRRLLKIKVNREERFRLIKIYGLDALKKWKKQPPNQALFCDCGRMFVDEAALGRHYTELGHPLDPEYNYLTRRWRKVHLCGCDRPFPSFRSMEIHRLHHCHRRGRLVANYYEPLPCSCGEAFIRREEFIAHREATGHDLPPIPDIEEPTPRRCACGAGFPELSELIMHHLETGHIHDTSVMPPGRAVKEVVACALYFAARPTTCPCGRVAPSEQALLRHQYKYNHVPWDPVSYLIRFWNAIVAVQNDSSVTTSFSCECGYIFDSHQALEAHQAAVGHPASPLLVTCRERMAEALGAMQRFLGEKAVCSCYKVMSEVDKWDHLVLHPTHRLLKLPALEGRVYDLLLFHYLGYMRQELTCTCGESFSAVKDFQRHMQATFHTTKEEVQWLAVAAPEQRTMFTAWKYTLGTWHHDRHKVWPKMFCNCGFPTSPNFQPFGHHWCRYKGQYQCHMCGHEWESSWAWYGAQQRCSNCRHLRAPKTIQQLDADLLEYPEEPHPGGDMCTMCRKLKRNCSKLGEPPEEPPPPVPNARLEALLRDSTAGLTESDIRKVRWLIRDKGPGWTAPVRLKQGSKASIKPPP